MKLQLILFTFFLNLTCISQTCDEYIEYVKSKSTGNTYNSSSLSEAIKKVTFYEIRENYKTYYFAIVCFKTNKFSSQCSEYIYQVASTTKSQYALHYFSSPGKAFWKYINPYNENLGCAPNME